MYHTMAVLTDAELRMVAEIVMEMSKYRGRSFDKEANGVAFGQAALIDAEFRARLADVHRQIEARRTTNVPRRMLAPIAFRGLERDAEAVLSGWKGE